MPLRVIGTTSLAPRLLRLVGARRTPALADPAA